MSKIALATLVEDTALYPRHNIDDTHVSDLVRAIASGATMPPIVADKKSLRIVDGFHRRRALMRVYGEEVAADVTLHPYKSDADLFLAAVELNSAHGRRLDRHDQTRIVLKLREWGIQDSVIALRLHVPEPVVQKLSVRIVYDHAGQQQPSKRGFEHLQGHTLTVSQMAAVDSVRSGEVGRLCIELTKILQEGLVDLTDERTTQHLRLLADTIGTSLQQVAA